MKPQAWFWFSCLGFPLQPEKIVHKENENGDEVIDTSRCLKMPVPSEQWRRGLAALQAEHGFDTMDCALWLFLNRGAHFDGLGSFWAKFKGDLEIYLAMVEGEKMHRIETGEKSPTWDGRTVLVNHSWRMAAADLLGYTVVVDPMKQKLFPKGDHRTYKLVKD